MERWAVIKDFPDYEVSDQGNVRRITPKRGTIAGRLLKRSRDAHGYAVVNLYKPNNGGAVKTYVHRVVAMAFVPCVEGKSQVAHWDGDGMNPCAENLRWVSQSENEADKRRHGRAIYASKGSYTFNEREVEAMRALNESGTSRRTLALMLGVSHNTVSHAIKHGVARR
jgi:hypothetical protein